MIKYLPLLLAFILMALPQPVIAGDIGGGGSMALRKAAKLDPRLKNQLLETDSEPEALKVWMQSLPAGKKQILMRTLFETHVLPQLDE